MGYVMPNIGGSVHRVLENLMKVRKEIRITDIARKDNSMTDKEKLDAIRAEIRRLVDVRGYSKGMANDLFTFMDSLPNEPVNKDFELALAEMIDKAQKCVVEPWVVAAQWKDELIKLAKSEEPVTDISS